MMSLVHAFNDIKLFDYVHYEEVWELSGVLSFKCVLTAYSERTRQKNELWQYPHKSRAVIDTPLLAPGWSRQADTGEKSKGVSIFLWAWVPEPKWGSPILQYFVFRQHLGQQGAGPGTNLRWRPALCPVLAYVLRMLLRLVSTRRCP